MYLKRELGNSIQILRALKESLDPNHIMNPGALLYEDEEEERIEMEEVAKYHQQ